MYIFTLFYMPLERFFFYLDIAKLLYSFAIFQIYQEEAKKSIKKWNAHHCYSNYNRWS